MPLLSRLPRPAPAPRRLFLFWRPAPVLAPRRRAEFALAVAHASAAPAWHSPHARPAVPIRLAALALAVALGSTLPIGAVGALPASAWHLPAADAEHPPVAAVWPLDAPHPVLRPFAAPATRYSAGHRGIDIAALPGQPVYAIAAGTVSFAGTVVDRPVVSVTHADSLVSAVEPVTPTVAKGQVVAAGEQIGVVASSTHCTLSCIHLGLRLRGDYVSPLFLLGGIPRAVLLPLHPG